MFLYCRTARSDSGHPISVQVVYFSLAAYWSIIHSIHTFAIINLSTMSPNRMDAIFAKIAEETTKFQLGDEEVSETSLLSIIFSLNTDIMGFYLNRFGASYTTLCIPSHHRM